MRKKNCKSFCQVDHLELRRLLSTVYVSAAATGANNGTSWTNAYTDLQTALIAAASGTTIEVGQGTYKPTSSTDRTISFELKIGVSIYGGYAGTGQSNPDARSVWLYPTILSGDIGTQGDNADNSYHVVTANNTDSTALLDGFTITKGNATGSSNNNDEGGGIFEIFGNATINDCTISANASSDSGGGVTNIYSSPTFTNCTISGNTAGARGGGLYDYQSTPTLTDCTISTNTAHEGGGISNKKSSDPVISQCTLSGNTATAGGAISNYSNSSPELTDCILTGNMATEGAGAWNSLNSSPTLVNCVISGNTATSAGGGVFSEFTSNPALINCTLSGNSAEYGGAVYNNSNASATLTNSILWGDTASNSGNEIGSGEAGTNTTNVSFSDVEGGTNGVDNNIVADPEFIRAVGANGPTDFGDLQIADSSPAVNAGSNAAIPNGVTTDLAGNTRIIRTTVDMGAYEALFAHLVFDTSPPQNNTAGASFGFEVDIEDGNGNDIAGDNSNITVQIGSGPAGAVLNGTLTIAAQDGEVVFSGVNLTQTGTYTISATDGSLPAATSRSFTIIPGAAASLSISQQPVGTTAGQDIPLAVQVEDSFGNPVDGTSVTVALASGASPGALNGTTTLATTGGTANFSNLTINQFGTYAFTITDGSLPAVTSAGFVINPAASAKLVFIIPPANTVAGQPMTGFAVEIEDQFGNLEFNDTSTVSLTSSPDGIVASIPASHGIAEFTDVSSTVADQYSLSATDGSLTGANSTTFNITPGAPAQLIILQQPASTTAGQNIPMSFEVEDQFGNLTDGSGVTLDIASGTSSATLGGTLTLPTSGGIASFNNLTLDRAGAFTLTATDGSVPSVTTNSFTIAFSGPTLVFTTEPTIAIAGAKTLSFKVTAENPDGATIIASKAKIKITLSSGGKLLGTSTVPAKSGVASFSKLAIQKAGNYTLTASSAGLASSTSSTFTITAGAASKILFNPQPASIVHGTPFNVDVELMDKYGNVAFADTSTVSLVLGSHPKGATALSLTQNASNGLADFENVILDTAGTYNLKAADGKFKATSKKFTVS